MKTTGKTGKANKLVKVSIVIHITVAVILLAVLPSYMPLAAVPVFVLGWLCGGAISIAIFWRPRGK